MRLIEKLMEDCVLYNKIRTSDGYGSYKVVYQDGVEFMAAVIKNSSPEVVVADKPGLLETFTVVTNKGFTLEYHDAFRRLKDGAVFRVTGMTVDSEAPQDSTVQIQKVTAERWAIPDE